MSRLRLFGLVAAVCVNASSLANAQQGSVPTPESSLGFAVGADFKLATYD